jgi:hypothetical protein
MVTAGYKIDKPVKTIMKLRQGSCPKDEKSGESKAMLI